MHMAVSQLRESAVDFSSERPGFSPRAVHVGYVVNKVAFKQFSSLSISSFPCQLSLYQFFIFMYLSSGPGTVGP